VFYYLDIDRHQEIAYVYIMLLPNDINMILKSLWIKKQNMRIDEKKKRLKIKFTNTIVYNTEVVRNVCTSVQVSVASLRILVKKPKAQVFTASIADINKALV